MSYGENHFPGATRPPVDEWLQRRPPDVERNKK